jgi:hypothetical protein
MPGEWYILFTCADCQTRQILFPDLSQGRAKLRALYRVQCAKCGFVGDYDSETLERYQHPPTSDPQPLYGLIFVALIDLLFRFARLRLRLQRRRQINK